MWRSHSLLIRGASHTSEGLPLHRAPQSMPGSNPASPSPQGSPVPTSGSSGDCARPQHRSYCPQGAIALVRHGDIAGGSANDYAGKPATATHTRTTGNRLEGGAAWRNAVAPVAGQRIRLIDTASIGISEARSRCRSPPGPKLDLATDCNGVRSGKNAYFLRS